MTPTPTFYLFLTQGMPVADALTYFSLTEADLIGNEGAVNQALAQRKYNLITAMNNVALGNDNPDKYEILKYLLENVDERSVDPIQ